MKIIRKFLRVFLNLDLNLRRFILLTIDIFCFISSFLVTNFLFYSTKTFGDEFLKFFWILPLILIIGIPFYLFSGQYKEITRYIRSPFSFKLLKRNAILICFTFLFGLVLNFPLPSIRFLFLFWFILSTFTGEARFVIKEIVQKLREPISNKKSVAIYGAGVAGSQLASELKFDKGMKILTFFDDDNQLWGRTIEGVPIKSFSEIEKNRLKIDLVLLAMPTLKNNRRKLIIEKLESLNISVLQIPSLEDILSSKAKIDDLKPINIEDLLGREKVIPNENFISKGIEGLSICITGAGGSIGSELCRQIIKFNPKIIILIERNEPSLYQINEELKSLVSNKSKFFSYLGCAQNELFIEKIFKRHSIDRVFHCAAYKHVPIVESNPIEGIYNNIKTTSVLTKISSITNVKKFILVSSDKAVRPTNIMGASKRICELITFYYAKNIKNNRDNSKTKFSIVRFGNVLESSGSVVPLFKKQIKKGGPVTVTDKEVIRYFMTLSEAAQLVIQAATLSNGGELYLLDMGKPVNIYELAKRMIKLSGKTIKDSENLNGEIEIVETGLRPGEKLFEELLVNSTAIPTKYPLIYEAKDDIILPDNFEINLTSIENSLESQDEETVLNKLSELVPLWVKSKS